MTRPILLLLLLASCHTGYDEAKLTATEKLGEPVLCSGDGGGCGSQRVPYLCIGSVTGRAIRCDRGGENCRPFPGPAEANQ
jgi:hypothetical protein